MSYLTDLNWWVPEFVWEEYLDHIEEKWGDTKLYAGVFASSAMREYMDSDGFADTEKRIVADLRSGDPPHTQKKKESETPLSEKKKCKVRKGVHPPTKEAFSSYARSNGENPGVMFAYALREAMKGGRLGRIEDIRTSEAEPEQEPDIPYRVEDKKDYICEHVEPDPNGTIRAGDLRELISDVAGGSRVDDYLPDILDRLNYVHHPHVYGLYIPEEDLTDYGLTTDDPAIDRKPYEALDRSEKIEGIKETLRTNGSGMSVGRVHDGIFDGNGSTQHIRDLVHTVAESDGYSYKKTPGGTKVLRWVGRSSPARGSAVGDGGTDMT